MSIMFSDVRSELLKPLTRSHAKDATKLDFPERLSPYETANWVAYPSRTRRNDNQCDTQKLAHQPNYLKVSSPDSFIAGYLLARLWNQKGTLKGCGKSNGLRPKRSTPMMQPNQFVQQFPLFFRSLHRCARQSSLEFGVSKLFSSHKYIFIHVRKPSFHPNTMRSKNLIGNVVK